MRAFIAVDTSGEVRQRIIRMVDALKVESKDVRWVHPEKMHITMYFLGDLIEDELQVIEHVIHSAVENIRPFSISVEGVWAFPRITAPRVLWVGVKNDTGELKRMHDSLCRGFIEEGARVDYEAEKKYTPHITIGRVKGRNTGGLIEALDSATDGSFGTFTVSEVVLYRSTLTPQGPLYNPIQVFPLSR